MVLREMIDGFASRLEAALMAEQLRVGELQQDLEKARAEQAHLRDACASAADAFETLQAQRDDLQSRLQAMDSQTDRSVQDAENRLAEVQVCRCSISNSVPGHAVLTLGLDEAFILIAQDIL